METNAIGGVLIDLFELEAVVGLALLTLVIGVLGRALLAQRYRDGSRPHVGSRR